MISPACLTLSQTDPTLLLLNGPGHVILLLTLYVRMDSFVWFDTMNLGWSIVYIEGSQVIISLKIAFVIGNSVDPDEMLLYATFHLGPHCLPKYLFRSHQYTKQLNLYIIKK